MLVKERQSKMQTKKTVRQMTKAVTWYDDPVLARPPVNQLEPVDVAAILYYFLAHDEITTAVRTSPFDTSLVVFIPRELDKPVALPKRYMGYLVRVRDATAYSGKVKHA